MERDLGQDGENEYSPLLPKHDRHLRKDANNVREFLQELIGLFKSSLPVILAYALQNSLQTFSVMVVGRLNPEALATAAFSYMSAMATAWLIGLGGTTALDTLASASFTGSANKTDLGVLLQRGLIVLSAFYCVVAVLWWNSEPLFRALGQEEFICKQSPMFLRYLIPGGLGYIWFEAMKKYLQAQILNYVLIYKTSLGLYGAPIATGISYWLSFLLLVLYAMFIKGRECWGGFQIRKASRNLPSFSKLAFLGVIHVGTEWWAFEIVALAAGNLGTVSLAAQSVLMTADQVITTIPFGLGVATSARLGNLLGAQDAIGARRAAHASAVLSVVLGSLVLTTLMVTRESFSKVFNDDKEVAALVTEVMPYVALFQIADGLNGSFGGSLRGMGKQWVGAVVNLASYYAGALPLGIYLAFNGWGLSGLWMGQCIALYLVGAFEWLIVGLSSWKRECSNALNRLEDTGADHGE
ncbi:ethionine resistance protein [Lecanicillium sp. MT-2017a]|nr:ethionine resistance protein [Lecanicillium sp. MT-2017a]